MPFVDESKVTEWTNRLKSYFALLTHKHDASDITSGTLTVSQGGTGATDAATARTNLAVPSTTDLANIESSIAYVESTTAKTNHAAGDYFMLGNVLMKATAAIATGETINASKAVPATVQGQIDTLRDSVSLNLSGEHLDVCELTTFGRVAVLTARSFKSLTPKDYTNLATIPVGYRPQSDVTTIVPNYNLDHTFMFRVDASGLFRVYNYGTTLLSLENSYVTLTWIISQ